MSFDDINIIHSYKSINLLVSLSYSYYYEYSVIIIKLNFIRCKLQVNGNFNGTYKQMQKMV